MYLILFRYERGTALVDALLPAHVEHLERHHGSGAFLLSGRRTPRVGGVILCRAGSMEEVEAIVAEDPFVVHGAVEYEIVAFQPGRTSAELAFLKERA